MTSGCPTLAACLSAAVLSKRLFEGVQETALDLVCRAVCSAEGVSLFSGGCRNMLEFILTFRFVLLSAVTRMLFVGIAERP